MPLLKFHKRKGVSHPIIVSKHMQPILSAECFKFYAIILQIPLVHCACTCRTRTNNLLESFKLPGDFLELKFFFFLFLRLGKTCAPLVKLKISLTSFHFRIYKIMTQRKFKNMVSGQLSGVQF